MDKIEQSFTVTLVIVSKQLQTVTDVMSKLIEDKLQYYGQSVIPGIGEQHTSPIIYMIPRDEVDATS